MIRDELIPEFGKRQRAGGPGQREHPDFARLEDNGVVPREQEAEDVGFAATAPLGSPGHVNASVGDVLSVVLVPADQERGVAEPQHLGIEIGVAGVVVHDNRHVVRVPQGDRGSDTELELVGVGVLGRRGAGHGSHAQQELDLDRHRAAVECGVVAQVFGGVGIVAIVRRRDLEAVGQQVRDWRRAVFHAVPAGRAAAVIELIVCGQVLDRHSGFARAAVEAVEHEVIGLGLERSDPLEWRAQIDGGVIVNLIGIDGSLQQGGEVALEAAFPHVGEHRAGERGDVVEIPGGFAGGALQQIHRFQGGKVAQPRLVGHGFQPLGDDRAGRSRGRVAEQPVRQRRSRVELVGIAHDARLLAFVADPPAVAPGGGGCGATGLDRQQPDLHVVGHIGFRPERFQSDKLHRIVGGAWLGGAGERQAHGR